LLPAFSLWRREIVRFLRQRSRIAGALGTPVVFWFLLGSGLGRSFQPSAAASDSGLPFLEYAFPGTLTLVLLFTAIFAMISVIEDRRAGFLQAVVASPARRSSIVMGKILGSATLAVLQAALLLPAATLAGVPLSGTAVIATLAVLGLLALGLSGLGFLAAWPMESTQGFHAVMNLGLMPMWFLSGALFPLDGAAGWMAALMAANPLTYGVSALRQALYAGAGATLAEPYSAFLCLGVTLAFALLTMGLSVWLMERRPA
jgi:ABC-2 type transport system permease protein